MSELSVSSSPHQFVPSICTWKSKVSTKAPISSLNFLAFVYKNNLFYPVALSHPFIFYSSCTFYTVYTFLQLTKPGTSKTAKVQNAKVAKKIRPHSLSTYLYFVLRLCSHCRQRGIKLLFCPFETYIFFSYHSLNNKIPIFSNPTQVTFIYNSVSDTYKMLLKTN